MAKMYGILKSGSWWHQCKRQTFEILGPEVTQCPVCKLELQVVREHWSAMLRNERKKKDAKKQD